MLATGYSDPDVKDWAGRGGTGKHEPVMLTNRYGEGRIFYQVLGHVWPQDFGNGFVGHTTIALECPWFQKTLLRGCQWAATGAVDLD